MTFSSVSNKGLFLQIASMWSVSKKSLACHKLNKVFSIILIKICVEVKCVDQMILEKKSWFLKLSGLHKEMNSHEFFFKGWSALWCQKTSKPPKMVSGIWKKNLWYRYLRASLLWKRALNWQPDQTDPKQKGCAEGECMSSKLKIPIGNTEVKSSRK